VDDIAVRQAKDDELGTVAGLRWQWVRENNGTPAMARDGFAAAFVSWARDGSFQHAGGGSILARRFRGLSSPALGRGAFPRPLADPGRRSRRTVGLTDIPPSPAATPRSHDQ